MALYTHTRCADDTRPHVLAQPQPNSLRSHTHAVYTLVTLGSCRGSDSKTLGCHERGLDLVSCACCEHARAPHPTPTGYQLLPVNEECRRRANGCTLFYMPHCELFMYDNLLAANWNAKDLANVVVFGNSFAGYDDRLMKATLVAKAR